MWNPLSEKYCSNDNGVSIVAAAKLLEEKHGRTSIRFTSHTLQLVINAALKNTAIVEYLQISEEMLSWLLFSSCVTQMCLQLSQTDIHTSLRIFW